MKTYIVYINGIEAGMINADSHNSAEKKAKKYAQRPEFNHFHPIHIVSVAYTEI